MNHNAIRNYAEVWCRAGRLGLTTIRDRLRGEKTIPPSTWLALALLDSGTLSAADLRLARLLYDCVQPGDHDAIPADTPLQAFALLMVVSLGEGNVYLPACTDLLATCMHRAYEDACRSADDITAQPSGPALPDPQDLQEQWPALAAALTEAVGQDRYAALIGDKARLVQRHGDGYYFEKYRAAERTVETALRERFTPRDTTPPHAHLGSLLQELFVTSPLTRADGRPCEIDPRQQAAVALCALNRSTVITGGPGTGKTTIVVQVLRLLLRLDSALIPEEDIVLCAPTGRAAARLAESVASLLRHADSTDTPPAARDRALRSLRGRTVHSVLGYDAASGAFRRSAQNPVDAAVVVVDEVSMLDIAVFGCLLQALRPDTTLVLLGDSHQLPSVEAGAVLGSVARGFSALDGGISPRLGESLAGIIPGLQLNGLCGTSPHSLRDRLLLLTQSHRSSRAIMETAAGVNAPVATVAGAMREVTRQVFDAPAVSCGGLGRAGDGVYAVDPPELATAVSAWIRRRLGHGYATRVHALCGVLTGPNHRTALADNPDAQRAAATVLSYLEESVVLCVTRRGNRGSEHANGYAARVLRPMLDPVGHDTHYHGEPVLVTRNAPSASLFNGDRGVLLRLDNREYLLVKRPDRCELIPREEVPALEPSCAMTVHKSQGSEFTDVLLVLPAADHPLLSREIVYTALTRAKRSVGIVGTATVFDIAVGRRTERRSGLDRFFAAP
jgi:exodeoxyribonuclease V alpha subunit